MAHGNSQSRFIYKCSPWFVQSLIASYYGFLKSYEKYGKYYKGYYEYLNKSQWFTAEQLSEMQVIELKKLINYVSQNIPYYIELFKKLKLSADDFNSIDDLKQLPILTKEEVRANCARLISKDYKPGEVITKHTSGTSGKALKFIISKECHQKEYAFSWLHASWTGVKCKDKMAAFGGHAVINIDRAKPPFWVNNIYENQVIFSSYHMSKPNMKFYADKLLKFQPKIIRGYPSSIYVMALFLENEKITGIKPKAIITTSETLLNFQRKKIEKVFDSKVYSYYGNAENVANIVECEAGSYHVKSEYGIIEFINDNAKPVNFGETGRMICTGFLNYAMPLIRYDTGDIAIPSKSKCSCDRRGLLVKEIVGRVDDIIITPDGKYVGRLGPVFQETSSVEEVQIIQDKREKVVFNIVKRPEYNDDDSKKIIASARERLGEQIAIEIKFVSAIPRLPNGKFKFVISKVATELY